MTKLSLHIGHPHAETWDRPLASVRALVVLWVSLSPWILVMALPALFSAALLLNHFVVGMILILVSVIPANPTKPEILAGWFAGAWLCISPWILGYNDTWVLAVNSAVAGIALALLTGLAAVANANADC